MKNRGENMDFDDLDNMMDEYQQRPEKDIWEYAPKSVKATKGVMNKAAAITKAVAEVGRGAYEWYGYLVADSSNMEIARDIMLPPKQNVGGSHVKVEGEGTVAVLKEIEEYNRSHGTDYRIIGWIHNHANHSTFHSGTDDRNMWGLLETTSIETQKYVTDDLGLIEKEPAMSGKDDKLVIEGKGSDCDIEYSIDLKKIEALGVGKEDAKKIILQALDPSGMKIKEKHLIGFCYSIVVNNAGSKPHTEVAILEEGYVTKFRREAKRKTELEISEGDIELDIEELKKQIKEKMEFPSRWNFFREKEDPYSKQPYNQPQTEEKSGNYSNFMEFYENLQKKRKEEAKEKAKEDGKVS